MLLQTRLPATFRLCRGHGLVACRVELFMHTLELFYAPPLVRMVRIELSRAFVFADRA